MSKFYDDLKDSFEDIFQYRKGKITLRSEIIELPKAPLEYTANDIDKGIYRPKIFRNTP
jgi:hypothetical protein